MRPRSLRSGLAGQDLAGDADVLAARLLGGLTASASVASPRTLASLISIGRLMPASTSAPVSSITEIARLEGVPPNMSVSTITPLPASTRRMASISSMRRASTSSSGPIEKGSSCSWRPDHMLQRGAKLPGKAAMGDNDDADHVMLQILCEGAAAHVQHGRPRRRMMVQPPARARGKSVTRSGSGLLGARQGQGQLDGRRGLPGRKAQQRQFEPNSCDRASPSGSRSTCRGSTRSTTSTSSASARDLTSTMPTPRTSILPRMVSRRFASRRVPSRDQTHLIVGDQTGASRAAGPRRARNRKRKARSDLPEPGRPAQQGARAARARRRCRERAQARRPSCCAPLGDASSGRRQPHGEAGAGDARLPPVAERGMIVAAGAASPCQAEPCGCVAPMLPP